MGNAVVEDPRMIGHLGNCEHLREFLGPGTKLKAGQLCWFTDRTPHESLPLPKGTKRQFFRLVTSHVDVWYADHSTANPTGVKPGERTRIIHGSKFKRHALDGRDEMRGKMPAQLKETTDKVAPSAAVKEAKADQAKVTCTSL